MERRLRNAEYVRELVGRAGMPRNQIAALSGLSNTYIRDLENGTFTSIGREKLIALGVALSIDLVRIDKLLNAFDRTALTTEDIPSFLAIAQKSKLTTAAIPIRDFYNMELLLIPHEAAPGRHVVISYRPTDVLKAEGHRSYSERAYAAQHQIYVDLVETIGRARQQRLITILADHNLDQYVCKHCLTEYLALCRDKTELGWRIRHLENAAAFLEKFETCNLYLTETCPSFVVFMKIPPPNSSGPTRLGFVNLPAHQFTGMRTGQIAGFITLNKGLIATYKQEIKILEGRIVESLLERSKMIAHLNDLIAKFRPAD